jgi:hypothetical protein
MMYIKPFNRKAYDLYDGPACEAVMAYLRTLGHDPVRIPEIKLAKNPDIKWPVNGSMEYAEVQVPTFWNPGCYNWHTEWWPKPDFCGVLEKKYKWYAIPYGKRIQFFFVATDFSKAFIIKGEDVLEAHQLYGLIKINDKEWAVPVRPSKGKFIWLPKEVKNAT